MGVEMVKMFQGLDPDSDKNKHDSKKKEQKPPLYKKMEKSQTTFLGKRHTSWGQGEIRHRRHENSVERTDEYGFLECKESPLNIRSNSVEGSSSLPAGVLVSGPEERFLYKGQYHIFPKWFEMSNGEVYEATRICYSGAKGVVRVYFCASQGGSQGGFQTDKRMVVKVFTSSSDEFFIEREGSRRTLGISEMMQSWTFPDSPFVFAEYVDNTLRQMCASGYDKVNALRDVSRMVRKLNANLAARGAVYLDVTSLNIAYDRERARWKMIDLGGLYLRNFWSDVVTPSFVPPFLWQRNRQQRDGETFEIRGQSSTLEELRLVSFYGVLATFGALALESNGVRVSSDVYMLHSTFLRIKLQRNNNDSKPIFERYLGLLRGDTRYLRPFKEGNGKSDKTDASSVKTDKMDPKDAEGDKTGASSVKTDKMDPKGAEGDKTGANSGETETNVETDANSGETDANSVETDANSVETDAKSVKTEANSVKTEANSGETETNVETEANSVKTEANSAVANVLCKYLPFFLDENATIQGMNFAFDEICNL